MQALRIAASGMMAQQYNTEMIANNLANLNTTGFQRQRAEFHNLIYKNMDRPESVSSRAGEVIPSGVSSGLGVQLAAAYRIHEQGGLKQTDNNLDIAIQGKGLFQVQLPNGELAYTRDGSFQLDNSGQLVTSDGLIVQPAITVPADTIQVTINSTGEVLALQDGQIAPANLGVIQLANFPNEAGLSAKGGNLFVETASSGGVTLEAPGQTGTGTLLQGFVETSNVNAIEEVAALVRAQRAYEMNSKVISAADAILAPTSK